MYECKTGYSLDRTPAGPTKYKKVCTASGEFTEAGACQSILCGPPPDFQKSDRVCDGPCDKETSIAYPEELKYHCKTGYSLNERRVKKNKVSGNDVFFSQCTAACIFSAPEDGLCTEVVCGFPPSVKHASVENKELKYD